MSFDMDRLPLTMDSSLYSTQVLVSDDVFKITICAVFVAVAVTMVMLLRDLGLMDNVCDSVCLLLVTSPSFLPGSLMF
jgi:hypothetical protein